MNADEVRAEWAGMGTEFSPGYYAYYGPNETSERLRAVLEQHLSPDASILELGCSAGRHLEHLRRAGYADLHGVDINDEAFSVMAETYPELFAAGRFYHGAIEELVGEFTDGAFDAVYSVETLQHIHAEEEAVFAELARITGRLLITVEAEDEPGAVSYANGEFPLYYRDWRAIFEAAGMTQVETEAVGGNTLRAFRPD